MIVDLDVLQDLRLGLLARGKALAVDRLDLEPVVPALHRGIIAAAAPGAHAGGETVHVEQGAMPREQCGLPRSVCMVRPRGRLRRTNALRSASHTRVATLRSDIAQPTTLREDRSSTTAGSSQPWSAPISVMSQTRTRLGRCAVQSSCSRCAATGREWLEFVLALLLRLLRPQQHRLLELGAEPGTLRLADRFLLRHLSHLRSRDGIAYPGVRETGAGSFKNEGINLTGDL